MEARILLSILFVWGLGSGCQGLDRFTGKDRESQSKVASTDDARADAESSNDGACLWLHGGDQKDGSKDDNGNGKDDKDSDGDDDEMDDTDSDSSSDDASKGDGQGQGKDDEMTGNGDSDDAKACSPKED